MGTDIELGPRPGLSTPDRLERITDVVAGFVLVSLAAAIGSRLVRGDGARTWSLLRALQHDWRALLAGLALVAVTGVVWSRHQGIHERVRVLDGRSRVASIALLVVLGALVPVGSRWMGELAGRPHRSSVGVTVTVLAFLLVAILFLTWTRFAGDRELSDRWTRDESRRLRLSFGIALVLAAMTGVVGYLLPIAGPFLLLLTALGLPFAGSAEMGRLVVRGGDRRRARGLAADDDGPSEEE